MGKGSLAILVQMCRKKEWDDAVVDLKKMSSTGKRRAVEVAVDGDDDSDSDSDDDEKVILAAQAAERRRRAEAETMCVPCEDEDEDADREDAKKDIGSTSRNRRYACTHCTMAFPYPKDLKRHLADRHDIGVVWTHCPECDYKCKQAGSLKSHLASRHNQGVKWHQCDQCDYKCKQAGHLNQHMAQRHNQGVKWHKCPHCPHKTKQASALKEHLADTHDIGVTWHVCDADPEKCQFQSKRASHLMKHIQRHHARVFAQRKQEQEERVRRALIDAGWEEWRLAETMPAVGFFRREKRIDFNCAKRAQPGALANAGQYARIDFVLGVKNGFVFLEVDENQHRFGYGAELSCDAKRMASVMESLAVETGFQVPNVLWLRYNPHTWHVDGDVRKVPKEERERNLVTWLEAFEARDPLRIAYAFYDCDADGALEVLDNAEFAPQFAALVDNLQDFAEA